MTIALVGYDDMIEPFRAAFARRGHLVSRFAPDAHTNDLVRLQHRDLRFSLLIAFPPCRYLCSSGLHWNTRDPERAALTDEAVQFVAMVMDLPIDRWCVENPVGCLSSRIRHPDQIVQPHQFGVDASKKTCLWLHNLPPLQPTNMIPPRLVNGRPRWSNQADDGQNNAGWSGDRATRRRAVLSGFAEAMADQWGRL